MSGLLRQAGNGAGSKRPAPAPAAGQGDAKRLMTRPEIIDRRTPGDKFVSEATKLKDVRKEMHCVAVLVNGANKGRPNEKFLRAFQIEPYRGYRVYFVRYNSDGQNSKRERLYMTAERWKELMIAIYNYGVPIAPGDAKTVCLEFDLDEPSEIHDNHPPQEVKTAADSDSDSDSDGDSDSDSDDDDDDDDDDVRFISSQPLPQDGEADAEIPVEEEEDDEDSQPAASGAEVQETDSALQGQGAEQGEALLRESMSFWGFSEEWLHKQIRLGKGSHKVDGLAQELWAHQLEGIWRILRNGVRDGLFSAAVFDDVGVGKTFLAIGLAAVCALMHDRQRGVEENDRFGGNRHLLPEVREWHAATRTPAACPSGTFEGGFACPCVPGLLSHELVTREILPKGPTVVLVPPKLCSQWLQELSRYLSPDAMPGTDHRFEIRCLYRGINHAGQLPLVQQPRTFKQGIRGIKPRLLVAPQRVSRSLGRPTPATAEGDRDHNRVFLVLPASSTLKSLRTDTKESVVSQSGVNFDVEFPISPGFVILDEMHNVKGRTTLVWELVKELRERSLNTSYLVALSATPLLKGPMDLESFVAASLPYRSHCWGDPIRRLPASAPDDALLMLGEWAKKSSALVAKKTKMANPAFAGRDAARQEYEREVKICRSDGAAFCGKYFTLLRRTGESRYGTQPLLALPASRYAVFEVQTTDQAHLKDLKEMQKRVRSALEDEYNDRLQRWRERRGEERGEKEPDKESIANAQLGREHGGAFAQLELCATFSGMAGFLLREEFRFDWDEMKDLKFDSIGSSLYSDDFVDIVSGSAKMDRLYDLVAQMLEDNNPPKKMLVFARRRPTAFFIAAALHRRFSDVGLLLLGDESLQKRDRDLQPFKDRNAPNPGGLRICVTTYGKAGDGLGCLATSYVVLMEPGLSTELEKQAFGRVKRARQEFTPHLYQVINPGNFPERVRLSRQEARAGVFHVDSLWGME